MQALYPYTRLPPRGELHSESHFGPQAILAKRHVQELEDLVALRRKGWEEECLDTHFKDLRHVADNADDHQARFWFHKMKDVAKELDTTTDFVPRSRGLEFLDVGCAPGGFSSYTLGTNPWARGVGISLPESAGGHAFLLEPRYRPSYRLVNRDILSYDLSPLTSNAFRVPSGKLPKGWRDHFPLVILDGHALRTYHHPSSVTTPDELKVAHGVYRERLLIGQFIIALGGVCPGGTIVTRLSHLECLPAAQLLYLLDALSDTLAVHKPRCIHTMRGTCYVVAKGVARSPGQARLREVYLEGLKGLLCELGTCGPYGGGRMMVMEDLDFVVTADAILDGYLDRLVELGRGVWATQVDGLRWLFRQKGIH